ncbi:TetR-like C-terminal domain-containing protein [Solicola gregarius]|uniref:WHG domain-containing protein n=1 Tax=Solicola gregarius TaxID=2908642 RepID=A0AA46TLJ3_9ACTN|nr:TetR-like C-terminal domain-containing protein [Solicola gregarius]UYM06653.1 WHG domain-containing protein [Solicola gregarius]
MGRPRIHDAALRDRLLDLAAEAVAAGGVGALSVRSLARRANTSTTAVYTLFGGMPGLTEGLYARAFDRLGAGQRGVGAGDDPLDDIVALGRAYRETALTDPNAYRMMFGDFAAPDQMPDELGDCAARTFEPLVEAVHRAASQGLLPPDPDANAIATALWANVHGLVTLELGAFRPSAATDPAEFFETAVRAVVDGWRTYA